MSRKQCHSRIILDVHWCRNVATWCVAELGERVGTYNTVSIELVKIFSKQVKTLTVCLDRGSNSSIVH